MVAMMTKAEKLALIADDSARTFTLTKGGDSMEVQILDNGMFRCEVKGAVSSVNHGSADSLLTNIQRALGGIVKTIKSGHAHHHHTHTHGHEHKH